MAHAPAKINPAREAGIRANSRLKIRRNPRSNKF
jgi:hypothetical protein